MAKRNRAVSLSLDWDNMVKDADDSEKGSKMHAAGAISYDKDTVRFCTGSSYTGKWNTMGMANNGCYIYPHGCEYDGGFEDGMFHGEGTLIYPMGQKLEGYWEKGKMVAYKFTNVDGLEYETNWKYCTMPDRRFNVSIREGLMPAGREFMTNQQPERPLPPGCYDTGDGFYNPATRSVVVSRDPDDYTHLSNEKLELVGDEDEDFWVNATKMVPNKRHEWIISHCRKAWDEPAGYRQEFYEDWLTGRQKELEDLDRKYSPQNESREDSFDSQNRLTSSGMSFDSGERKSNYAGTGRKLSLST